MTFHYFVPIMPPLFSKKKEGEKEEKKMMGSYTSVRKHYCCKTLLLGNSRHGLQPTGILYLN